LSSLRPRLQKSVAEHVATDEERQVLHLIEFAASRFGDPLLHATSVDDLDDRLDARTDSPEALLCTELLAPHMPLVQASLPMSAALLAAATGHSPDGGFLSAASDARCHGPIPARRKERIGVVIEVRPDLVHVAYGTSEPHDDWPQVVVRPETRQGRALVLREVTYFYGANASWERPRDMQFGKPPAPSNCSMRSSNSS